MKLISLVALLLITACTESKPRANAVCDYAYYLDTKNKCQPIYQSDVTWDTGYVTRNVDGSKWFCKAPRSQPTECYLVAPPPKAEAGVGSAAGSGSGSAK